MQIKKDLPLLMLLALLFAALLINARDAHKNGTLQTSPCKGVPECSASETNRSISPLNFITKGIFHFS